jgi:hypothetical protein
MHTIKTHTFLFRLRSAVLGFTAAGLFYAYLPSAAFAQRAGGDSERPRIMESIDQAEGAKRMASFRAQRLQGDFCFKFQLEHKPRRERTVRYEGIMYGSWNERGPVSRFKLYPERIGQGTDVETSPIELIVQNGTAPEVWMRRQASEPFTLIEDGALFEPIFDGVLYSPFDLQMPFVFWNDYAYEGPSRVLSRIGQRFLMQPPAGSLADEDGIASVRIALDDAYYALLQVEVLEKSGVARSRFTVSSLKKVQGQYIVKEIQLKNLRSKDATDFKVKAASVGLVLDAAFFDPDSNVSAPKISAALFEVL